MNTMDNEPCIRALPPRKRWTIRQLWADRVAQREEEAEERRRLELEQARRLERLERDSYVRYGPSFERPLSFNDIDEVDGYEF